MGEHNCYRSDEAECIKEKAYDLWKKDGCKQGRDLDYWLVAEKTVKGPKYGTNVKPNVLHK